MKIIKVNEAMILFDNDRKITFNHKQSGSEYNYADFQQLEESAINIEFNEDLIFEKLDGEGFRFGNKGTLMFFIPCYSAQNGYYSTDIKICYNGEFVFELECEEEKY